MGLRREILQRRLEVTYTAPINACEKGQQWAEALAMLRPVEHRMLEPHVIMYRASSIACEYCQELVHA